MLLIFITEVLAELLTVCYILKDDEIEVVLEFNGAGD